MLLHGFPRDLSPETYQIKQLLTPRLHSSQPICLPTPSSSHLLQASSSLITTSSAKDIFKSRTFIPPRKPVPTISHSVSTGADTQPISQVFSSTLLVSSAQSESLSQLAQSTSTDSTSSAVSSSQAALTGYFASSFLFRLRAKFGWKSAIRLMTFMWRMMRVACMMRREMAGRVGAVEASGKRDLDV